VATISNMAISVAHRIVLWQEGDAGAAVQELKTGRCRSSRFIAMQRDGSEVD